MVVNVLFVFKYVPTGQSFSNDSSHCLIIIKNKIKLHVQKKKKTKNKQCVII